MAKVAKIEQLEEPTTDDKMVDVDDLESLLNEMDAATEIGSSAANDESVGERDVEEAAEVIEKLEKRSSKKVKQKAEKVKEATHQEAASDETENAEASAPDEKKLTPKTRKSRAIPVTTTLTLSKADGDSTDMMPIIDGLRKKVAANANNFLKWLGTGKGLGVYIQIGLRFTLNNHKEGFKTSDLMEALQSKTVNGIKGYAKSTALPQSANYVSMAKAFKLIKTEGNQHVLNIDSPLWERIEELL